MIRALLLFCITGFLLFTSCSEDSTSPVDLANGLNFTLAGAVSGKFSATTATAVTTTVDGEQVLAITGTQEINGKDVTVIISVFSPTKKTYDLTLQNVDDPPVFCTINVEDVSTYGSTTGTLKITEYGTSLGSKVKGTFSFNLYDAGLNELKVTSGTFNLLHLSY